jgi:hypothetical protein
VKLSSLVIFGAGYVMGSRAGRARYEQFSRLVSLAAKNYLQPAARDRISDYSRRLETFTVSGVSGVGDVNGVSVVRTKT